MQFTFSHLNDSDLVSHTRLLVSDETKATQAVLHHLREIERRGIHLRQGYRSLHEFTVARLGYSDGAAARRIQAMRLIRDLPETEKMLASGTLTIETMSVLQRHFQTAKPKLEEKRKLVAQAQSQSRREIERSLGKPEAHAVYLKPETLKKLEALKIRLGITELDTLIAQLADRELKRRKPAPQAEQVSHSTPPAEQSSNPAPRAEQAPHPAPKAKQVSLPAPPAELSLAKLEAKLPAPTYLKRYVPKPVRRYVIARDQARCTYRDRTTGRRCTETRHLQFDHAFPFALGGETSAQNLRLLCANHNRLRSNSPGRKTRSA